MEGIELVRTADLLDALAAADDPTDELPFVDPDDVAVLLFTSGTTGEPKAAVLRHRHLTSYIFGSVEFLGADEDQAQLVSVPPYHIAGISAVLSSVYSGRRIVYLPAFDPEQWVGLATSESDHPGDGRADDARPRPRTPRRARPRRSTACATSPTAVGGCRSS